MLVDHHGRGPGLWIQPTQPGLEEIVEHGLPDANRGIGPDLIDHDIRRELVGGHHPHPVAHPVGFRVGSTQVTGSFVDVDGPHHGGVAAAQRQGHGDRSVSAAQVDQVSGAGEVERLGQQDAGARVDLISREHPAIGQERHQPAFGQDQVDGATIRTTRRRGTEVVVAGVGLG